MDEKQRQLQAWVSGSSNIVFFGGAGVSTESGIPDFRSVDGLYSQQYKYPPETIISHSFFQRNPEEFYQFYREKMLFPHAKPKDVYKRQLPVCGRCFPAAGCCAPQSHIRCRQIHARNTHA